MSETFKKQYFETYGPEGDEYDESWFRVHYEEESSVFDSLYSGETNCNNFASGDESWVVLEGNGAYWGASSDGTVCGPYETVEEVGTGLGFSAEAWDTAIERCESGECEEDDEEE